MRDTTVPILPGLKVTSISTSSRELMQNGIGGASVTWNRPFRELIFVTCIAVAGSAFLMVRISDFEEPNGTSPKFKDPGLTRICPETSVHGCEFAAPTQEINKTSVNNDSFRMRHALLRVNR